MVKIKFNEQQMKVINFMKGNCCVIAGAGGGKSTTLIGRVEKMIEEGIEPCDIMMITFTRNSADDLKNKLYRKNIKGVKVGTFHSICGRILSEELKQFSTKKLIQSYMIENCFKRIDNKVNVDEIMRAIDYQKSNMIGVFDEYILNDFNYSEEEIREFYKAYENLKETKGLYDFSDWLSLTIPILEKDYIGKYTVEYLLVDESQDCNLINHKLAQLLCPNGNIMMVGDVRQSIYGFRAANPKMFMDFDKEYDNATILNIDNNYRSNKNIVENANHFIKQYLGDFRYYSDSIPTKKEEGFIDKVTNINKGGEAQEIAKRIERDIKNGITPNQIAVLYRNNSQVDLLEGELKLKGIDYHIEKNDSFFERREIKLIICMLRLLQDPSDDSAFEYIYKKGTHPFSFMTKETFNRIIDKSAEKNISLFEASDSVRVAKPKYEMKNILKFKDIYNSLLVQYNKGVELINIINNIIKLLRIPIYIEENYEGESLDDRLEGLESFKAFVRSNTLTSFLKFIYSSEQSTRKTNKNEVQLMTIHKSKGLEFRKVYIIGIQDGKFPSEKSSDMGEEARLFYVGITRAKEDLVLSELGFDNKFIEEYFN
ncbi:ATP-dependent helicase [Clostridium perfringens]|uniref:ATP-dependent helicase n=1 Tax=Clostridium perfringens TaxID=1502 RepID=UPI0024BD3FE1|nr:ATP-dependent helicase [Clostridium perfringens]CAJ1760611.1 DNA helicase [uncultured phage]